MCRVHMELAAGLDLPVLSTDGFLKVEAVYEHQESGA
jgi:hypothetical protein